ncbi:MAG: LptF/LptG family permease [Gemmatimonadetes bacterium]|nr:LptF/LptG family permease [Gemmatimonadota bacterium]
MRLLDRYVGAQFLRIFAVCVLGVPLMFMVIDLTDNIDDFIDQGVSRLQVTFHYLYQFPYQSLLGFPIASLLASVFTISALTRRSEITAMKAGGVSFYRTSVPLLVLAALLSFVALALSEIVAVTNRLSVEALERPETRSQTIRLSFVYRADEGLVYKVRRLDTREARMDDMQIDREGTGPEFPTMNITSNTVQYDTLTRSWRLQHGWVRRFHSLEEERAYEFLQMAVRELDETPEELRAEPKDVNEMRYGELGKFIDAIERSGGTAHDLETSRAQRLAFPFACLIITLFGMPLAHSNKRGGAPLSIGIALATTTVFLIFVRITEALGAGGAMPAQLAAWLPNLIFLVAGLFLFARVRT